MTRPMPATAAARPVHRAPLLLGSALVLATACGTGVDPTKAGNGAPTVTVSFDGASSCTPQPGQPCTLSVTAHATDPDSDGLRFAWSGCATGSARQAVCRVERPGPVSASVEVSDGHGNLAHASASATGTNRPPNVQVGGIFTLFPGYVQLLGNVVDPDEGLVCGRQYCLDAVATGACGPTAFLKCTCLGGLEAEVHTESRGTCTLTLRLADSWGQVGEAAVVFDVRHPEIPAR